jgi:hypothetical protein
MPKVTHAKRLPSGFVQVGFSTLIGVLCPDDALYRPISARV